MKPTCSAFPDGMSKANILRQSLISASEMSYATGWELPALFDWVSADTFPAPDAEKAGERAWTRETFQAWVISRKEEIAAELESRFPSNPDLAGLISQRIMRL